MSPSKAAILGVTAVVVALTLTATVFAGPNPKSWLEVLVMNGPGNPVPVDVIGAVDVAVDDTDPIAVDVQNAVKVDDSTPIKVEVQEPLEVEGTIDLVGNIDLSGWLHTTTSGTWSDVLPKTQGDSISINTEGYRQATIIIEVSEDGLYYLITYKVDDAVFPRGLTALDPIPWYGTYEVLPVVAKEMIVYLSNGGTGDISFNVTWYLTT